MASPNGNTGHLNNSQYRYLHQFSGNVQKGMPESAYTVVAFSGLLGLLEFASSPFRCRASPKGCGVNLSSAYRLLLHLKG